MQPPYKNEHTFFAFSRNMNLAGEQTSGFSEYAVRVYGAY